MSRRKLLTSSAPCLSKRAFSVELSDSLGSFADEQLVYSQNLLIPVYTMSEITPEQFEPVRKAVAEHGIGIAGCHGGMCDSFRTNTEWQFVTGSQWVAHPGNDGVRYMVNIGPNPHEITAGLPDFEVVSEQYYLHVDPGGQRPCDLRLPTARR